MINVQQLATLPSGQSALPPGAQLFPLAEAPCPVLLFLWPGPWETLDHMVLWVIGKNHSEQGGATTFAPAFRCAALDRLPTVIATGCDVTPPGAVIWVDDSPAKALEYGGEAKVLMVFDARRLEKTSMELPADADPEELARLRQDYPTMLKATDGKHLWLSRLQESDRQVGTNYEIAHARWIPGDPWEALLMVVVLAHDLTDPDLKLALAELQRTGERG